MKRVLFAGAIVFALVPRPAAASPILMVSDGSFTVNWFNPVTTPGLSASARFNVANLTSTGFDLTVDLITNSTAALPDINARLVSFGLDLTPGFTSTSNIVNGSVFSWGFSNFPAFAVDICGYSGNNCAGGGGSGLTAGQSMSGSMSIHFNGSFAGGVTFAAIPVKFQTGEGSFEFDGCVAGTPCDPVTPVPEPASLLLLGTGLVVGAATLRRRANRRQLTTRN